MRALKRLLITAAATAAVVASSLIAPATASAAINCVSVGSSFSNVMTAGHCIKSPNGRYALVMQYDGNLVLYRSVGGAACWASSWSGGGYRAGDEALFSTIGISLLGGDTEYGLAVGHPVWGPFFSATWRYDNGDFRWGNRNYNVNVNDNGQFWVAYDQIGSC